MRAHLVDPRPMLLGDTVAQVGKLRGSTSDIDVTVIELGPGNVEAAAEAGKVSAVGGTDILLFVGIAGALKDLELGDVVAANEVASFHRAKLVDGERLARPKINPCSRLLVQLARYTVSEDQWQERIADPLETRPRAFIGQVLSGEELIKDSAYKDELKRAYSDALAIENEGFGLTQVATASMLTLVIRSASDAADESKSDSDQERAAQSAAAFAAALLENYGALVDVMEPEEEADQASGTRTARDTPESNNDGQSSRARASELVQRLRMDRDLIEDDEGHVREFARREFDLATDSLCAATCERLAAEFEDASIDAFSRRRLQWFGGEYALQAVLRSAEVDWDAIAREMPTGASGLLAQEEVIPRLLPVVRRRVLSGLTGPPDSAEPMGLVTAERAAYLLRTDVLSKEEIERVLGSVEVTPYGVLLEAGWTWDELFPKLEADLASGTYSRQNVAARILLSHGSPHLDQDEFTQDHRFGMAQLLTRSASQGSNGAKEATTISLLADWPVDALAHVLWGCLRNDGRRLDFPRSETKSVLRAAVIAEKLSDVLNFIIEAKWAEDLARIGDDAVEEDQKWLLEQAKTLTEEAQDLWATFVDSLFAQIPRRT